MHSFHFINRNQFECWRSCDCVIGNGQSSRHFTIPRWNEICSGKLVRCTIGRAKRQKRRHRGWRSVCLNCLPAKVARYCHWLNHFALVGISNVRPIMVYLFHWLRYHCLRYRARHVCRVPIRRNRSIRSAPWEALHQRIRLAWEWAHRYRSPPPLITLSTAHTKHRMKLIYEKSISRVACAVKCLCIFFSV